MRIAPDTDVLVRVLVDDDEHQSRIAQRQLLEAEWIALGLPALCEVVWVLAQGYGIGPRDIAEGLRRLTDGANILVDRPALEAGLPMLDAGGDFADAVIAHEGRRLGGDVFVSFDRRATKLLAARGEAVALLS